MNKNQLSSFEIFRDLSDDQLSIVEKYLEIQEYEKDSYIIQENTAGNSLYLLFDGKVRITKKLTMKIVDENVEEKMLAVLSDKDFPTFGEIGLVGAGKRTANVIAVTNCRIYCLSKISFEKITKEDIYVAYVIMKSIAVILAKRLEKADNDMLKLATALSLVVTK